MPPEVASAWDVPREASLPGMAEALGLVRSALHAPLKALEEERKITTRQAHVIGGGSRKRTVAHITDEAREAFVGTDPISSDEDSQSSTLYGRDALVESLQNQLEETGVLRLDGIAGIGKTALAQHLGNAFEGLVISVVGGVDLDLAELSRLCLARQHAPRDPSAAVDMLRAELDAGAPPRLILLDDLHRVHSRHSALVLDFADRLEAIADGESLSIIRVLGQDAAGRGDIRVGGIEPQLAIPMLGEIEAEMALDVAHSLGGHPLAMQMWSPEQGLPEASEAIRAFVEEAVLAGLDPDSREAVELLSLEPAPIELEGHPAADAIDVLDEAALLRWPQGLCELNPLVQNVVRASLGEARLTSLSAMLAASTADPFHRLWHLGVENVEAASEELLANATELRKAWGSARLAALIEQVAPLESNPPSALVELSASLALDLGEPAWADHALSMLDENEAMAERRRLHLQQGQSSEAIDAAVLSRPRSFETERFRLDRIVRTLDDRLPDDAAETALLDDLETDLSDVRPSGVGANPGQVRAMLVLIAMLRHRLALLRGEHEKAAALEADLAELGGDAPLLERLSCARALEEASDEVERMRAESALRRLMERTAEPVQRVSLGLQLVKAQHASNPEGAATTLEALCAVALPEDRPAARRLIAHRWFWVGVLETAWAPAWQEAVARLRAAECPAAAKALTARMHARLR